jgi:hypothetical protein
MFESDVESDGVGERGKKLAQVKFSFLMNEGLYLSLHDSNGCLTHDTIFTTKIDIFCTDYWFVL